MSRFGLLVKRIKITKEIPDRARIFCINHVYLSGDKVKIYKNGGNHFENNCRLFLHNVTKDKWYEIINRGMMNAEEKDMYFTDCNNSIGRNKMLVFTRRHRKGKRTK